MSCVVIIFALLILVSHLVWKCSKLSADLSALSGSSKIVCMDSIQAKDSLKKLHAGNREIAEAILAERNYRYKLLELIRGEWEGRLCRMAEMVCSSREVHNDTVKQFRDEWNDRIFHNEVPEATERICNFVEANRPESEA